MAKPDTTYWLTQLVTEQGWNVSFTYNQEDHRVDVRAEREDELVTAWGMQVGLAAKNLYDKINGVTQ